jgi:hypothetical protein
MACYRTKFNGFCPLNRGLGGIRSHLDPLKAEKIFIYPSENLTTFPLWSRLQPITAVSWFICLTLRRSVSLDFIFYVIATSNKVTDGAGLFPCITIFSYQFSVYQPAKFILPSPRSWKKSHKW